MKAAPLVATVVLTGATNAADRGEALLQGAKGYYDKTDVIIKWKEMALIRQLLAEVRASDG
jgi:predicted metal-binding protein